MAVLQRSERVDMSIDEAERCWRDFAERVTLATPDPSAGRDGQDSGTVYFSQASDGTTEVTVQIDPDVLGHDDEATLNRRVDSYLKRFKKFVENRTPKQT